MEAEALCIIHTKGVETAPDAPGLERRLQQKQRESVAAIALQPKRFVLLLGQQSESAPRFVEAQTQESLHITTDFVFKIQHFFWIL